MTELERITSRLGDVRDAETMLAGIVAHLPIPVILYCPDGRMLAANKALRELMGTDVPPGYNILTNPTAVATGVTGAFRRALAGEHVRRPPHWFDNALLPGAGRKLGLQTWFFPLHDGRGAVQYVASCCTDVTAELLLQEEHDRQQALRECSEEVTVISLPDGAVTYASPSSERVLGYRPEELIRLGRQILHPEDLERWKDARARLFTAPGVTGKAECRLRHKDGTYRRALLTSIHLAGHPTLRGIITHILDITALKAAEEAAARAAELEAENRRIRAVNETRREMLAYMSHELRTPLNAIVGFGELLHDGEVGRISKEQAEFLDAIGRNAKHLLALIGELLELAGGETGKLNAEPGPVDLTHSPP